MHVEHEIRDTAGGDKHIDSEHYSQINKEYQAQPNGKTEHSAFLELNGSQSLAKLFLAWILLLYRGSLGLDKDEATVFVLPSSLYNDESLDCEGIVSCRPSDLIPDDSTLIRDVLYAIEQKRFALVNKMQTFAENNCWYFIVSSGNVKNYRYVWRVTSRNDGYYITTLNHNFDISKAGVSLQLQIYRDILKRLSISAFVKVEDFMSTSSAEIEQHRNWTGVEAIQIDRCMHDLFGERAQSAPMQQAVISWDGCFTYGELDRFSNSFAYILDRKGIKSGDIVPVCFEKSAWTVVAVLAIMKVGAAFTLTDPQQPIIRLKTVVNEVGARCIITSPRHRTLGHELADPSEVMILDGPTIRDKIDKDMFSPIAVDPDSPMYIIFTSGSTGKPKGVIVNHANYTSGAIPRADIVGYQQNTRVLDFASYAFDVSIDCMLLTLATGGCFCVPSEDERMNDLSNAIRRMNVNMVHTTPSIARVLDPDIIPSLDVLGLGGEAVPSRSASEWSASTRVLVAYGPSECTVGCAFNVHDSTKAYTSLGRGCGGSLWIVDQENHNKLCPIGGVGELLVSGPIVGPGYINQHEATSRVFVENPKWLPSIRNGNIKQRFYKTGDLVRYDPDGSGAVVFVGRKDSQVKIRGQRVELEEVEHHLRQRLPPGLAAVAEVICPTGASDPVLVAFIANNSRRTDAAEDAKPDHDPKFMRILPEIVSDLHENVPKYMVPSAFIPLHKMPMMVSGKTDRKSLRKLGASLSWQDLAAFNADGGNEKQQEDCQITELESTLGNLWSDVLGTELEFKSQSNFFSEGGDSLKAMRLVAAARLAGFALSVNNVFASPTLARMAAHLEKSQTLNQEYQPFSLLDDAEQLNIRRDEAARLCGIESKNVEDLYACTPLQEALMALSAKRSEAYIAQRLLKFPDEQTVSRFCHAFEQAVLQTPILRTRIVHIVGHGLLQVVVDERATALITPEEQGYLENDQQRGMQLGDKLLRAALISGSNGSKTTFVLTMHHAIYDGWSIPLFVSRINRFCENRSVVTAPSFALFVRHLLRSDRTRSAEYWRTALDGTVADQFPKLPFPGYETQADSLLEHHVTRSRSIQSQLTLATRIRAAWAATIAEHTQNADIVFGETLAGRNAAVPGIEAIEGPCITTVPLRLNVKANASCEEFMTSVQEATVRRMSHEHFGLQHIRQLSPSAYAACELRTGIVLHPQTDDADKSKWMNGLADGLVPVNDKEAAKEALQFNSYALMLVVTPLEDGFLVMASFDSNVVATKDLRLILTRFDEIFQILSSNTSERLCDFINLRTIDKSALLTNGHSEQPYTNGVRQVPLGSSQPSNELVSSLSAAKEARLRRIWKNLLGSPAATISKDTNFFGIGGDSISAMKLVSELRSEGYKITVKDIFAHRRFGEMCAAVQEMEMSSPITTPFETETSPQNDLLISASSTTQIRSLLQDSVAAVTKVYRARPLQEIAVRGSTQLPRYSMRYELFQFNSGIDKQRIKNACQELVLQNEILRTSFVKLDSQCLAVVVREPQIEVTEHTVDEDVVTFAQDLSNLDIRMSLPLGTQFVKFWLILGSCGDACLVVRLSHAQYDEMCLPLMWHQLKLLYEGQSFPTPKLFSKYSEHVTQNNFTEGIPYWKEALRGSKMSILPGPSDDRPTGNNLAAIAKAVSVKTRPTGYTIATLPTAAWALCLARRLSNMDVTFGEVVSGRQIDFPDADKVIGPCWQYIPARIKFQPTWRVEDLLQAVQTQHIINSKYEGMGLSEIVEHCTDWPKETSWFDSVVHQAVAATETLDFGGSECRVNTFYPHAEPLREWKVQAFLDGDMLTLEIVTFREWEDFGKGLLNELVGCFELLLGDRDQELF